MLHTISCALAANANSRIFLSICILILSFFTPVLHAGGLDFVEAQFDPQEYFDQVISPDGKHIYVASNGSGVGSITVFGRDAASGRLTVIEVKTEDDSSRLGGFVSNITISPDGEHVYVLTINRLSVFRRDSNTGLLTFVQTLFDDRDGVDGLAFVADMIVSNDGAHVYVTSTSDNSVTLFARDASSGELSLAQHIVDDTGGVNNLGRPETLALSPDGLYLYVGASVDNALNVFSRNPSTGILTFFQSLEDDDGVTADGLEAPAGIVVSPDNGFVYVIDDFSESIAVFARDVTTNMLTFVQQLRLRDIPGFFAQVNAVAISTDGRFLYATAGVFDFGSIVVFARNAADGTLTISQSIVQGRTNATRGLGGARSVILGGDDHLYLLAPDDDVVSLFERNSSNGQVDFVEGVADTDNLGLGRPTAITTSPDGMHVYVASDDGIGNLAVFSRDSASGALTHVQHLTSLIASSLPTDALAFSPDGNFLYFISRDSVDVFQRNSATGEVTQVQKIENDTGMIDSLNAPSSIDVSADGLHVYVADRLDDAITVFSRDIGTGMLSFVQVIKNSDAGIDGLDGVLSIIVSADGEHVYTGSSESSDEAIAIFSRDNTTGQLTFLQALRNGDGGITGLGFLRSLAFSPDDLQLYTSGSGLNSIVVFDRSPTTGLLTFAGTETSGLGSAQTLTISPDGARLYAASFFRDFISIYNRDLATGVLSFVDNVRDEIGGVDGIDGARVIAITPDGLHVYVIGNDDDAVAVFATVADLVINEVDYDQGPVDEAEFIEILARGSGDVNLSDYRLDFAGASGNVVSSVALANVTLSVGDRHVVCTDTANVPGCTQQIASPPSDWLSDTQAGIGLFSNVTTLRQDSLSYAGPVGNFREQSPPADIDNSSGCGLSRVPDGADSQNNEADFRLTAITPGAANSSDASACNVAPVANNDSYNAVSGQALTIAAPGLLTNDSDAEGNPLTVDLATVPAMTSQGGTLSVNADGSLSYTSANGFTGNDTFTYQANDGMTNSNTATVTITVAAANVAPVANNDRYSAVSGQALTIAAPGLLANDSDAEGNPLTVDLSIVPRTSANGGTLSVNANGGFTYTSTAGFTGNDRFTYQANDGMANSNTATVTIVVGLLLSDDFHLDQDRSCEDGDVINEFGQSCTKGGSMGGSTVFALILLSLFSRRLRLFRPKVR